MGGRVMEVIACAVPAVFVCLAVMTYSHIRQLRMFRTLDRMLEEAIDGNFSESHYDESRLSSFEIKLARYLTQCSLSSGRLMRDRERLKGLISDISHQTKTPLASILLYAGLLREYPIPKECVDSVDAIAKQAEKLQFLIDALVKSGRLELGVISVHPRLEALSPCIAAAAQQVLPFAAKKNVSVSWAETDAKAVFDPKWTQEAVFNLLDNAVKYTPPDGEVRISVKEYEMFCRIDVEDSGIGVKEEELGHIFERFYRSPSVRNEQGVGLGLYLAREIVAGQGGYIKAASEFGKGSRFSVFLIRRS